MGHYEQAQLSSISLEKVFSQTSLETTVKGGWVAGKTENKANLSLI